MARKVKYLGGVGDRGLGMELRHYREKAGMSCAQVGAVLGRSADTISRLERGLRPETTAEEVPAIVAAVGVTGTDRDRIMRMAKGTPTSCGTLAWGHSGDMPGFAARGGFTADGERGIVMAQSTQTGHGPSEAPTKQAVDEVVCG